MISAFYHEYLIQFQWIQKESVLRASDRKRRIPWRLTHSLQKIQGIPKSPKRGSSIMALLLFFISTNTAANLFISVSVCFVFVRMNEHETVVLFAMQQHSIVIKFD